MEKDLSVAKRFFGLSVGEAESGEMFGESHKGPPIPVQQNTEKLWPYFLGGIVECMQYLHTMIRVYDLDAAIAFFSLLGLREVRRKDSEKGRFTLVFLQADGDDSALELTYNWDQAEPYGGGRNFGHIAYAVEDIYALCEHLHNSGVTILRPPRDGRMAFVRSPDQISVELLQKGDPLPLKEPWVSMPSQGEW